MARSDPQVVVRLPEELKIWLKVEAVKNRRSQNAEIVQRLEASRDVALYGRKPESKKKTPEC